MTRHTVDDRDIWAVRGAIDLFYTRVSRPAITPSLEAMVPNRACTCSPQSLTDGGGLRRSISTMVWVCVGAALWHQFFPILWRAILGGVFSVA